MCSGPYRWWVVLGRALAYLGHGSGRKVGRGVAGREPLLGSCGHVPRCSRLRPCESGLVAWNQPRWTSAEILPGGPSFAAISPAAADFSLLTSALALMRYLFRVVYVNWSVCCGWTCQATLADCALMEDRGLQTFNLPACFKNLALLILRRKVSQIPGCAGSQCSIIQRCAGSREASGSWVERLKAWALERR